MTAESPAEAIQRHNVDIAVIEANAKSCRATMEGRMDAMEKRIDEIRGMFWWILSASIGSMVASLVPIILKLLA